MMTNTLIKLIPPQLTVDALEEQIVCTRPMRLGKFNISMEERFGKAIFNCYGHGGSGWTTLFGSVNRILQLFEATKPQNQPIRVLGAGCMGLTVAIELKRRGYNCGITTKEFENASWNAGGFFALVSMDVNPEEEANLNQISMETFRTFQQIERGEHPYIRKEAVKFIPVYCTSKTEAGIEELEAKGLIPPKQLVTLDFGNGIVHSDFVKYETYFMETASIMKQLTAEVQRLGIPLTQQEVTTYSSLSEPIIFNCTGLGARELNGDTKMVPVLGHLITLNAKAGSGHMDYMIFMKEGDEYIYLFPKSETAQGKCSGVLGGTFISRPLTPAEDALEFQRLQDRARKFFHGF